MAIEKVVRCDSCKKVVEPNTGFVVLGNIHKVGVATVDRHFEYVGNGLIGNNLNEDDQVLKAVYYCDVCFADAIGIKHREVPV